MTKNTYSFFLIFMFLFVRVLYAQTDKNICSIQSPGKKLSFRLFFQDKGGRTVPCYTLNYESQRVVLPSELGINSFFDNLKVIDIKKSFTDTVWKPLYGERNQIRDIHNQVIITFNKPGSNDNYEIIVRVGDEGVALRYRFPERGPGKGGRSIQFNKLNTQFAFQDNTTAWFTDKAQGEYRCLPLAGWPAEAERPLTLTLQNGLYACIGEAAMVNFSRTKFKVTPEKAGVIQCSMYDEVQELAPFETPWQFIMVAENPGTLLANNFFLLNLNEPCQINDVSWINPGKIMREVTLSTSGAMQLVDFAVKHKIKYIHFDAGWYGYEYQSSSDAAICNVDTLRSKQKLDLHAVIKYAKENNIGVWLYVNQLALSKQLDSILPLYQSWGISGVKFGFVHVGSFRWTTWLHEAVKKCAKYHLMVDIHDEYRPTGFSRTYPNLLTQEGVRGNEEMPDALNNTVLPFTRFIAGPADYTLCYFDKRIKTTHAHQLALAAIYYSPLQFLYWYDKPFGGDANPELEFWDKIPTIWDDTKILQGEIGKYITVARRSGNEWFIGSITNNEKRRLTIPLTFLDSGKAYRITIYSDEEKEMKSPSGKVKIESHIVNSRSILKLRMCSAGGTALYISPLTMPAKYSRRLYK